MPIVAFDNKEFLRGTKGAGEFYTPLGVGVWFKEGKDFPAALKLESSKLASNFGLMDGLFIRCADQLKYSIDLFRAIPYCDQLVSNLSSHIKQVHFSYVIIPPKVHPEIQVGGLACPTKSIPTHDFLRMLNPMFSYIAAWAFLGPPSGQSDWELHIDGFRSKPTAAWADILKRVSPKVFPHGDECNSYVNMADLIAFLTNIKLGSSRSPNRRSLRPENIAEVWSGYPFNVDVRFIDAYRLDKLTWKSDTEINLGPYLARPMIFLMVDDIAKSPQQRKAAEMEELEPAHLSGVIPKAKKQSFMDRFKNNDAYRAVANYAYLLQGGFQSFDKLTDGNKIQDGDILAYAGAESRQLANTYADMFDVKIMSISDIRKELQKHKVVS